MEQSVHWMRHNYLDLVALDVPTMACILNLAWLLLLFLAAPFFPYLAKSSLKPGLFLSLVSEEFLALLGVPVRPILAPVGPLFEPIRPVDLLSAPFSLSCPPSVEAVATTQEVLFYRTPFSCLSSPMITFFPLADSAWCGRINTFGFDNASAWTGKGFWSICIAGTTNRPLFMADCICQRKTLQSLVASEKVLCNLQYAHRFNSSIDGIVWENLIFPSFVNSSKSYHTLTHQRWIQPHHANF